MVSEVGFSDVRVSALNHQCKFQRWIRAFLDAIFRHSSRNLYHDNLTTQRFRDQSQSFHIQCTLRQKYSHIGRSNGLNMRWREILYKIRIKDIDKSYNFYFYDFVVRPIRRPVSLIEILKAFLIGLICFEEKFCIKYEIKILTRCTFVHNLLNASDEQCRKTFLIVFDLTMKHIYIIFIHI